MADPTGVPGTWTPTFADEFPGSSIDTAKWQPNWLGPDNTSITPGINSLEDNCVDPARCVVNAGNLEMSVHAQSTVCNGLTKTYRAAVANTWNKFSFTYGFIEARINVPASSGSTLANWPAFWTAPTDLNAGSEIDVLEGASGTGTCNYHYGVNQSGPFTISGNWTGWHTYGCNKQAGRIDYYWDGVLVRSVTSNVVNDEHFLILQNVVRTGDSNTVADGTPMLVDYVRAWSGTASSPASGTEGFASSSSWSVPGVTSPGANDWVFLGIVTDSGNGPNATPSGFTSVGQQIEPGSDFTTTLYRKKAATGPYTVTFAGAENGAAFWFSESGIDGTTPLDVAASFAASSSSTTVVDSPSITPVNPSRIIGIATTESTADTTMTWDSPIVELIDAYKFVGDPPNFGLWVGEKTWTSGAVTMNGDLAAAKNTTKIIMALRLAAVSNDKTGQMRAGARASAASEGGSFAKSGLMATGAVASGVEADTGHVDVPQVVTGAGAERVLTVRIKPAQGRWTTLGMETLSGIVPENFSCSTNETGPDTCSFTLRRHARRPWPDLLAFNQCEVQIGNSVVWGGRIWEAPLSDTQEEAIAIQGRGWQYHLDDDLLSRFYVHTALTEWRDQRSFAGASLSGFTAIGQVNGGGQGQTTIGWSNGTTVLNLSRAGITLDLGPGRTAKRIVLTFTKVNPASFASVIAVATPGEDSLTSADVAINTKFDTITSPAAGTFTVAGRYVTVYIARDDGLSTAIGGDELLALSKIQVFSATAYESGNASVLKASQVVTDVLGSGALPLLDSSTANIATTSFSIPELAPEGYQTPRALITMANAYESKLAGVDAERRLFYRTRDLIPTVEIGAWSGADFTDASTNSGEGLYNKVIVQGTGPDGAQINEVRTTTVSLLTRQGFSRTAVLAVGAPMTTTSAQQLGDIWLAEKSQPPMKGTVTIAGTGGARNISGGGVHASEMLLRVGERLRLSHLPSPNGDWGRDATIKSVTYSHDTETASVELDNERGRLEALLERLAVVTSQITI